MVYVSDFRGGHLCKIGKVAAADQGEDYSGGQATAQQSAGDVPLVANPTRHISKSSTPMLSRQRAVQDFCDGFSCQHGRLSGKMGVARGSLHLSMPQQLPDDGQ